MSGELTDSEIKRARHDEGALGIQFSGLGLVNCLRFHLGASQNGLWPLFVGSETETTRTLYSCWLGAFAILVLFMFGRGLQKTKFVATIPRVARTRNPSYSGTGI